MSDSRADPDEARRRRLARRGWYKAGDLAGYWRHPDGAMLREDQAFAWLANQEYLETQKGEQS